MTLSGIAHIARYAFAFVIVWAAVMLLHHGIGGMRKKMRWALHPVHGFFLIQSDVLDRKLARAQKLFHTTIIGTSRFADIRRKEKGVRKNHAMIYLFNGVWYLRPLESGADIWHNGVSVDKETKLTHGDSIGLGTGLFNFIDDRLYGEPLLQQPMPSGASPFALILTLAFIGAAGVLMFFQLRGSLAAFRPVFMIALGAFVFCGILIWAIFGQIIRGFDAVLFQTILLLAGIGLILQARLTFIGQILPDDPVLQAERIARLSRVYYVQGGALVLGFVVLPFVVLIAGRGRLLEKLAVAGIILTPLFYLVTYAAGRGGETHGARLWLYLPGGISLQLTEFAKILYVLVLAYVFKNRPTAKIQWLFAGWAAFNFGLMFLLPDLGSIMILLPVTLIVFAVMTSEFLKTILILIGGSALAVAAYRLFPYVQRRIFGWMSLWEEINDQNRQIVYGLQAVARGGLFGVGLGNGAPGGIPLASSDMVFSVLAEEFGMLVGLSVVILFVVIWLRGAGSAVIARDGFSSSVLFGAASLFFMEALVVIGGTTGLIPLTGVTLPFIAQGGSSMLAKTILLGVMLGVQTRTEAGAYEKVRRVKAK